MMKKRIHSKIFKSRSAILIPLLLQIGFLLTLSSFAADQDQADAGHVASPVMVPEKPGSAEVVKTVSPVIDPDGADPFVLKTEQGYIYTKTTGSDICLYKTDSILKLGAAAEQTVYRPGSSLKDLWAPEIWRLDGCWYIYFAAVPPGEEMHYMYVLENPSEDPFEGEWTCSAVEGMDDKFAIDGTVLELGEKRYFIWSGWEGYTNVRQDLYLAEMVSPKEVLPEKILLSRPERGWETIGDPDINEGPEILVCKETVNLVYSASGSWTDDYCLGLLTLETGKDPKDPENWMKDPHPVLRKKEDVYGPGHNCFTVSEDGSETLLIYHAARWEGSGWTRNIRFGYPRFDETGKLLPMEPVSAGASLPVPSGSSPVTAVSLDQVILSENLTYQQAGAESEEAILGSWKPKTSMKIPIQASSDQDAVLVLFVRTSKHRDRDLCTLGARLSGITTAACVYASDTPQPVMLPVSLQAGENEIEVYTVAGKADLEIIRMEIR